MQSSEPRAFCGAKTRNGETCKNPPVTGRTRCRMHGGATPRGIASPHFKTGRYSDFIRGNVLQGYEAALTDETLLELNDEIALIDGRLREVLNEALSSPASSQLWRDLREAYRSLTVANRRGDEAGVAETLSTIGTLITQGHKLYNQWQDVVNLIDTRRRLVESQRKRKLELQQNIPIDQAMTLISTIVMSVKTHVTDPYTLRKIVDDLSRLGVGTIVDARSRVIDE